MSNYVGNEPARPVLASADKGRLIQSVSHLRADYFAPAGVVIPLDDTIPQIGEGTEYFSIPNFAPLFIGSRIRVRLETNLSVASGTVVVIAALFRSGTPDALAVSTAVNVSADAEVRPSIDYEFIAASLAPFTYSVRFGGNSTNVLRLNGRTARLFGGAYNSFLRIDEFAP